MEKLWQLFYSFFKIGLFTFGGGYAMLPMLEYELVERHGWETEENLLTYFAVAQCTPGVIAVNTATFVGRKQQGFLGAVAATFGVVLPSLIIITLIAMVLSNFAHLPVVINAFAGIRVAVGALIVSSVIKLMKSNVKNAVQVVICIIAFLIVAILGASPVWVVLGSGLFGILFGGKARVKQ